MNAQREMPRYKCHKEVWAIKIKHSTRSENVAIMLHTGCYPFYPTRVNDTTYFQCHEDLIEKALAFAENTRSVRMIILSGYAEFQIDQNTSGQARKVGDAQRKNNLAAFEAALETTLSRLLRAGKKVVYVVDVPELLRDPKTCLARLPQTKFDESICAVDISREDYRRKTASYQQIVRRSMQMFPQVTFTRTEEAFCDEHKCYASRNNSPLYASRDHLTPLGSKYFIARIADSLSVDVP